MQGGCASDQRRFFGDVPQGQQRLCTQPAFCACPTFFPVAEIAQALEVNWVGLILLAQIDRGNSECRIEAARRLFTSSK